MKALRISLFVCAVAAASCVTWAKSPTVDPLEGQYRNDAEPDTTMNVYRSGNALMYETEVLPPTELQQASDKELILVGTPMHIGVHRESDGAVDSLELGGASYRRVGPAVHHLFRPYTRQELSIPMRDGVLLHAVMMRPTDTHAALPFLLERTPYGVNENNMRSLYTRRAELARSGYIFVFEDIRGRFGSGGTFVMSRPLVDHADRKLTDESTDAWDTVDWLLKHVPENNGKAGVRGTSYVGFTAMEAGIDPHPAVKAVSPQAPMIDVWMGDDFFHNGAFRQSYGYDYVQEMERTKESSTVTYPEDGYDMFLSAGSAGHAAVLANADKLPTWQVFLNTPEYGKHWRDRAVELHLNRVAVPTLSVGGYYDQEDLYGPQAEYEALEKHDSKGENFLVLGPWRHGSWSQTTRHIVALQYGAPIGRQFREQIETPYFDHYLKGSGGFTLKDTATFQTGSNTWKRYAHFPPATSKPTPFYLNSDKTVSRGHAGLEGKVQYISDPANPVAYRARPIQPTYAKDSQWGPWMVENQRPLTEGRSDVLSFAMPVQASPLTITGDVFADLFASTSGTDSDWVVKLIDEYPQDDADPAMRGYQLMIAAEIFRGRYVKSFEKPEPLKAGVPQEFGFSLHSVDHVFQPGHRLVVQVQSTWFPVYDRNPQRFVPNIMKAQPSDYEKAVQTIYQDKEHASRILLPVVAH